MSHFFKKLILRLTPNLLVLSLSLFCFSCSSPEKKLSSHEERTHQKEVLPYQITVTLDDLPLSNKEVSNEEVIAIHERILKALSKFKAPAVGFVNEQKVDNPQKKQILKQWIQSGHELGNHTYSHPSLSTTPLKEFEENVQKGALISRPLMEEAGKSYRYFRHPYLHTGTTQESRHSFELFLKKEGYLISPVTIDTDDWKFNAQLLENPNNKEEILKNYLQHTRAKLHFYQQATQKIFNRNIRHIWLLHANLLNSYAMEDLLSLLTEEGYSFISHEKALEDPVYQEEDRYYAPFGTSWLYRWDFTRGKKVDWSQDPEPGNNSFLEVKEEVLYDKKRKRKIPIITYVSAESKRQKEAHIRKLPLVLISHGRSISYKEYSFIAEFLTQQGFFVVSVQHDLPSDPPLSTKKPLFQRRKPSWKRGGENLSFVLKMLKEKEKKTLDWSQVTLIGHSQGGDLSLLFTQNNPGLISQVISLDHLRVPFQKNPKMRYLWLRAMDTQPDSEVLSAAEIQASSSVRMIFIDESKHIDFCDRGPQKIQRKILETLRKWLSMSLDGSSLDTS